MDPYGRAPAHKRSYWENNDEYSYSTDERELREAEEEEREREEARRKRARIEARETIKKIATGAHEFGERLERVVGPGASERRALEAVRRRERSDVGIGRLFAPPQPRPSTAAAAAADQSQNMRHLGEGAQRMRERLAASMTPAPATTKTAGASPGQLAHLHAITGYRAKEARPAPKWDELVAAMAKNTAEMQARLNRLGEMMRNAEAQLRANAAPAPRAAPLRTLLDNARAGRERSPAHPHAPITAAPASAKTHRTATPAVSAVHVQASEVVMKIRIAPAEAMVRLRLEPTTTIHALRKQIARDMKGRGLPTDYLFYDRRRDRTIARAQERQCLCGSTGGELHIREVIKLE